MKSMATIRKVERIEPDGLRVYFGDGAVREIKLARYARKGTAFAALADPDYALRCRIADRGHALRWPDGMDMSADALTKMGKQVESGLTNAADCKAPSAKRAA